jgi:hypothetical protein
MIKNGLAIGVNYRPGAGGNFIQNCLGLSRHCLLRHRDYADWHFNCATVDTAFYQQKLQWVLNTIQPGKFSTTWLGYELGAEQFIGFLFNDNHSIELEDFPPFVYQAADQGIWITHTAHNFGYFEHLHRWWPTVKHVNVHADQWAQKWMSIKNPALSWDKWAPSPIDTSFNFYLDEVIHSEQKFMAAMKELYNWLNFDDFDQTPVTEFYRAYILAHKQQTL